MKRTKKILAWLLMLTLLMGMLPGMASTAWAAETEEAEAVEPPGETTPAAAEEIAPETTEPAAAETTEATVPETTEAAVPETTEATIPETTEATVPETTEATIPETTEATVPETTEATVPETTEETVPETTEETIPEETLTDEAMLSIGTDASGNTTFETFADLKYLAEQSYSDYTTVTYAGTGPLVITESITIPQILGIIVQNGQITVPAGVTLTVSGYIFAGTLQIDGTMRLQGQMYVTDALNVSGTLQHNGLLSIELGTPISGGENIQYGSLYGRQTDIARQCDITDLAGWNNAIAAAKQESNQHINYNLNVSSDVTLSGSTTVGGNMTLNVNSGTLRIPAGCTLELTAKNSTMIHSCYNGKILVEGTLVNHDMLAITYQRGATLQIANGGAYSGSGGLLIETQETSSVPQAAVVGLDLSHFQATYRNGLWELTPKEGKKQLGTPTNLQWGRDGKPGNISWTPVEPFQGEARIAIYKQGQDTPVGDTSWRLSSTDLPEYHSADDFIIGDFESGTYYFTVTAIADGAEYYSSETALSDTWTYTKPEAKLGSCGNFSWSWPDATFSLPENAGGFDVEFYYAPTLGAEPRQIGGTRSPYISSNNETCNIQDDYVQQNGDGYYYFKVRALSSDITKSQNGPWSELSPAYCLSAATESVNSSLDTVIQNEAAAPAEIKQAVQDLNTDELKSAMLADQSGTGTVAKLQELEEKAGTTTKVEVTNQASDFDQSKVSIVGAGLNDVKDETKDIKLVVDKPAKENVIPAQYNNSVAVKFSMGLDNVQNTKALEVPVKITLPVPDKINPSFLVVLHYHADGSMEEIHPYIYREGTQSYASFVLTSFSDFAMVEKRAGIPGDLNGDGTVNEDDAIYLLLYLALPELYELHTDGNIDSKNGTNEDDAIYLLLYLSLPEAFPLYPTK